MQVLIVGGGKMGRYLAKNLSEKEINVILIEQDQAKCTRMANDPLIRVLNGDGSEPEVLKKAGVEKADVLLAVTNDDHDNLAICQVAERQFHVPRTFTAVNTPGNEKLFEWLGVNVAVSSSSILEALVTREISLEEITSLLDQKVGDLRMVEIRVSNGAPVAGKKIKDIELPMEAILVTILRGDTALVPRGNTVLRDGDRVLALADNAVQGDLVHQLNGGAAGDRE